MGLKIAATLCALLGLMTSIVCLFAGPWLYGEMSQIRAELADEMRVFREQSEEIWQTILHANREQRRERRAAYDDSEAEQTKEKIGTGRGKNPKEIEGGRTIGIEGGGKSVVQKIVSQQQPQQSPAAKCRCAESKCSAGPKGPRGPPGARGQDGAAGEHGLPGASADDVQAHVQQLDKCFHCPQGPAGPPGLPGAKGARGMRGGKGQPGVPGRDGQPGFPGGLGPTGKPGPVGIVGETGIPGEDTKIFHGRAGLKGPPGPVGDQGDLGPPGSEGALGPQGPEGDKGEPGIDGKNGEDGEQGQSGDEGEPGADAEYCPCPSRNSPLFNVMRKESEKLASEKKGLKQSASSSSQIYRSRFHKQ